MIPTAGAVAVITALLLPVGPLLSSPTTSSAELSFVRVINAYAGPAEVTIALEDEPPLPLTWTSATPWTAASGGEQRISVTVAGGGVPTTLQAELAHGCSTTVVVHRTSTIDGTPTAMTIEDCINDRIPPGQSRITAVGSTVTELGPVEFRLHDTAVPVHPDEFPVVGLTVPRGAADLAVGARGTDEVFDYIQTELEMNTSYTLLYLGGGETPAELVMFEDARQAPDPPPPDLPINTGSESIGGLPALLGYLLATALLMAEGLRRLHSMRGRHPAATPTQIPRGGRCAATALSVVVCAACSTPLMVPTDPDTTQTTPRTQTAAPRAPAPPPSAVALAGQGARPTALTIPALRRSFPLTPFATADISRLPESLPLQQVSWLEGSSPLGLPGTTAVIGHTTAPGRTPAPFNDLAVLLPGELLEVTAADGSQFRFEVVSIDISPKGALPLSVFAPHPVATLVLITCTDSGTSTTGSYQDNLVVTALLNTG